MDNPKKYINIVRKEIKGDLIMNNFLVTDIYFSEEAREASSKKGADFGLHKFGIVVDESIAGIIIKDGFVKVDVYFAKLMLRTSLIKSLPGRHLVETFTIFVYENGLTLSTSEFRDIQLEMFRILVGNGIISSCSPSYMVKAYKALKRNGIRALLAAAVSGESKHIRAWKCLTCKRFRANNDGTCSCKGYRFSLPDSMKAIEIANMYPDATEDGGVLYSSIMPEIPKSCGVSKPRVKTHLTKSVIYELDDQISIKRKIMNIDIGKDIDKK
jgi:hypothetical protein